MELEHGLEYKSDEEFSLEKKRLGGTLSLSVPEMRLWPGGDQALLPCNKFQYKKKLPQAVPRAGLDGVLGKISSMKGCLNIAMDCSEKCHSCKCS